MTRGPDLDARVIAEHCERHYGAIYRYIAYRVNSAADAEDLASEVFVRALESRAPIRTSVLGLLYRIAENLIIDHYRSQSHRRKLFGGPLEPEAPAAAFDAPDPSDGIDIRRGLRCLTGEQYQVIVMRFLEGYPIQEVAAALGKSPGAIKALQFRALARLRDALREVPHVAK